MTVRTAQSPGVLTFWGVTLTTRTSEWILGMVTPHVRLELGSLVPTSHACRQLRTKVGVKDHSCPLQMPWQVKERKQKERP